LTAFLKSTNVTGDGITNYNHVCSLPAAVINNNNNHSFITPRSTAQLEKLTVVHFVKNVSELLTKLHAAESF
jgi:hypothetical protein